MLKKQTADDQKREEKRLAERIAHNPVFQNKSGENFPKSEARQKKRAQKRAKQTGIKKQKPDKAGLRGVKLGKHARPSQPAESRGNGHHRQKLLDVHRSLVRS